MRSLILCLLSMLAFSQQTAAAEIPFEVQQALVGQHQVAVIVELKGQADVRPLRAMPLAERRRAMVHRLKAVATDRRTRLLAEVPLPRPDRVKSLWHINSLAVEVDGAGLAALAANPEVEAIRLDAVVHRTPTPLATAATAGWNIAATGAPELWALGYDGSGMVVASLDTGVDYLHDDLFSRWRGGSNSWYNPYAAACQLSGTCGICDENSLTPCDYVDDTGFAHGTAVMSVMVAGDATGVSLGVAPGAQWIAAKIFKDDNTATFSAIHQAFGWLLDPDDDPSTDDMPDVVNNSWGLEEVNLCDTEFFADLERLRDAGISLAFSAGNTGPFSASSISPGNNGQGLAVGAVDEQMTIAPFSARGPSACGGIYPDLVAPGVSVQVAHFTFDGSAVNASLFASGTSFSAPHASGMLALLREAFPSASVDTLDLALLNSATDLGTADADNTYGYGAVDGMAAYQLLTNAPHLSVIDPVPPQDDQALPFGSILPGSETTAEVMLSNVGGGGLSIVSVGNGLTSPFFVENDLCGNRILANAESCTFTVRFAPLTVGARTASLNILTNAGTSVLSLSGTGNRPPLAADLVAPADGAIFTVTSVKFSWLSGVDPDGGAVQNELLLATNSAFTGARRIEVASAGSPPTVALATFGGGLFLLAPLLGLASFRKRTWLPLAGFALLLILANCGGGGGGGGGGTPTESVQVDDLQNNTEYYWKVETTDSLGGTTDSEVRSFSIR